ALAVFAVLWFRAESDMRQRAETARREIARSLYAAHVNLAMQAWDEGHVSRVRDLLAQHVPRRGEEDLRSFEWYYLWRLAHGDWMTLGGHHRSVLYLALSADCCRMFTDGV